MVGGRRQAPGAQLLRLLAAYGNEGLRPGQHGEPGAATGSRKPSLSSLAGDRICEGSRVFLFQARPLGDAPAHGGPRICPLLLCRSCRGKGGRGDQSNLKQQLGLTAKESRPDKA